MSLFSRFRVAAVLAVCAALGLWAQERIVALPGAGSASQTATVFQSEPVSLLRSITVPAGAFQVFVDPTGARFYFLSFSSSAVFLTVTDSAGNQLQSPINVGSTFAAGALTPDGQKLLLLSGTELRIFDIHLGAASLLSTLSVTGTDLAVSHDSRRAFVLNTTAQILYPVDLSFLFVGVDTLSFDAKPNGVATAPNGLLYVSAAGRLIEIDGGSAANDTPSVRRQITLPTNFSPTRPVFSPDGVHVIMGNALAGGPSFAIYHVADRRLETIAAIESVATTSPIAASNDRVFAIGSDSRLYELNLASLAVNQATFNGSPISGNVVSITTSDEISARNLYVATDTGDIRRVSLAADPDTIAESTTGTRFVRFVSAAHTGVVPSSVLTFNADAVVSPGTTTAPLVVRTLDSSGHGIAGIPVSWNAPSFSTAPTPMSVTNAQGYAQAAFTAPFTEGITYVVTATVGAQQVSFSIHVSSFDNGGDNEGTGVVIISGQGQVRSAGSPTNPLIVEIRDAAGNPIPFASVIWEIEANVNGTACIAEPGSSCVPGDSVLGTSADASGRSRITLTPLSVGELVSFAQFRVTASTGIGTAIFAETATKVKDPIAFVLKPSSGTTIRVPTGGTAPEAIQVQVVSQDPPFSVLPNIGVRVLADGQVSSTIRCVGDTVLTNASGIATCDLTGTGPLATHTFSIQVGELLEFPDFRVQLVQGPPAKVTVAGGNNQSGRPGELLPQALLVEVRDAADNPVGGNVAVTFEIVSGTATLSTPNTTTDALGRASTRVTLGATPGDVTIRARSGTGEATFTVTVAVAISGVAKMAGDNQSAVINSAFATPLTVQVNSSAGPLASVPVTFAVTGGTATLDNSTVTTNAQGQATVNVTAGNTPGTITVTATAGGQTTTFTLTARMPGPVLTAANFLNGASFQPGVAFGSIVTIQAEGLLSGAPTNLAAGTCASGGNPAQGPLATRVNGIEVDFSGHAAPIFSVCRTVDNREQVSVQVPFELAPARILAVVRTGMGTTAPIETLVQDVEIVNAKPGVFQWQTGGKTIAVAVRPDGSYVTPSNPARKGEVVRIFATGLGPTLPLAGTNQSGIPDQRPFFTPVVLLGGRGVSGVNAAYAENMIGVFTVDFTVPSDASAGDAQLTLNVIDGTQSIAGSTVVLPIQ